MADLGNLAWERPLVADLVSLAWECPLVADLGRLALERRLVADFAQTQSGAAWSEIDKSAPRPPPVTVLCRLVWGGKQSEPNSFGRAKRGTKSGGSKGYHREESDEFVNSLQHTYVFYV